MENADSERSLKSQQRQVSAELLRTRSTFSKSVMVSVAVSILGTTELMFIEPGVKINGAYYRDVLLGQHLLPAIRSVAGDFFTYNAPAHQAGDFVEICKIYVGKMIIKATKRIFNSDKIWCIFIVI